MDYVLIPNLLTNEQCDALIANAQTVPDMAGDMSWKDEQNFPEVRSSRLRWLNRGPLFDEAFAKIDAALDRGDQEWGFRTAHNPIDAIQFTEYHEARLGHYDWHQDDFHKPHDRLLSICIQLSDPETYEGGTLELRVPEPPPPELLCQRGTAIVFPSTTTHRVTQTLRGRRYSAVAWRLGERPQAIQRAIIQPDFYHSAAALRAAYDGFFAQPETHHAAHQCFDYWFVPDIYTYLRTSADRILTHPAVQNFVDTLRAFTSERLGLSTVTWPYLSVYTNGMHQALHNDAMNGQYGYVYSLTRWHERKFTGGETLLGRDGVFDAIEPRIARGRGNYFETYEPHFNQLMLFDDRLPHMVPAIVGTMDPREARVVLHGHIQK